MEEIMVTVCCLAYNHEKYIKDALEGFVNQKTDFAFEVLVHDDASSDRTQEIILQYAERYPDLIKPVLQRENQYSQGIQIMMTYVYPKVRGKYMALCEGDDYWCDDSKLQKQVDFMEANPGYSACVHNTRDLDCRTGKVRMFHPALENRKLTLENILPEGNLQYHTSSLLFRKEYYDRPKTFWANGFGDYSLSLYLSVVGEVFCFGEVMSVYRRFAEGSWSSRMFLGAGHEEREIAHFTEVNRMLERIDIYTEGKYHNAILQVQRENQCCILRVKKEYARVLREYRDVFRTLPGKEKRKIRVSRYLPFVPLIYRNMKAVLKGR